MVKNLSFSEKHFHFLVPFFLMKLLSTPFFLVKRPPSSGETVEPALPILEIPSQQKSRISTHPADLVLIHSIPKNMPMTFH